VETSSTEVRGHAEDPNPTWRVEWSIMQVKIRYPSNEAVASVYLGSHILACRVNYKKSVVSLLSTLVLHNHKLEKRTRETHRNNRWKSETTDEERINRYQQAWKALLP
jgi:hypothetical protein